MKKVSQVRHLVIYYATVITARETMAATIIARPQQGMQLTVMRGDPAALQRAMVASDTVVFCVPDAVPGHLSEEWRAYSGGVTSSLVGAWRIYGLVYCQTLVQGMRPPLGLEAPQGEVDVMTLWTTATETIIRGVEEMLGAGSLEPVRRLGPNAALLANSLFLNSVFDYKAAPHSAVVEFMRRLVPMASSRFEAAMADLVPWPTRVQCGG